MADSILYVRDPKTSDLVPLKAYDNGDGTYTLGAGAGSGDALQSTSLAVKAKTDLIPAGIATDLADAAILQYHFHNYQNGFGLAAAPSGTHGGDLELLTPYVVTSGNGAFGTALLLLGTADTPVRAGNTYFDVSKIIVTAASDATVSWLRMIWGTAVQTSADAITAVQYSDIPVMKASAAGQYLTQDTPNYRIPAGGQVWAQLKNATNNATISFLISMHEYTV